MKRIVLIAGCAFGLAGPALALSETAAADTFGSPIAKAVALEIGGGPSDLLSRRGRGADDPAGDDRGHHGAGHAANEVMPAAMELARRGRGADDPAGDDRGGHGPGHA